MASKEEPTTVFTVGETKLLVSIMKHMTGNPNTDWNAVALDQGYKDASIAKTRYSQIKKKKIEGGNGPDSPSGGVDKASSGNLKAAKPKKAYGDGAEGSPTRAKRGKKAKKGVEEVKEENEEDDVEGDGDKVKMEMD